MKNKIQKIKKGLYILLAIIMLLVAGLYATGNGFLVKAVGVTYLRGYKTASIDDGKYFSQRIVLSNQPTPWQTNTSNKFTISDSLQQFFQDTHTAQFVVIKNDQLLFDHNFRTDEPNFNSFSMTKSITTLLLGFAIQDGYIKDINESIINYLPELKDKGYANKVRIADLVKMSSGLDWVEKYYSPFDVITKSYYDAPIDSLMLQLSFPNPPNQKFNYQSGNTQLVGMIIKRATKKNLSTYLQEKVWNPLGMEGNAEWSLDQENGMEKSFCCFEAIAKDYAKIGKFIKDDGKWNQKQILDSAFVTRMKTPDLDPSYGYSLWIDESYKHPFYMLKGHLGQYTIIVPQENLIIVRFAEKVDKKYPPKGNKGVAGEIYFIIDQVSKGIK